MNLFGGCDCATKIAGLEGENTALREALADLTTQVEQLEARATKTVIAHFDDERRKAMLRKKEEREERGNRLVLPALI